VQKQGVKDASTLLGPVAVFQIIFSNLSTALETFFISFKTAMYIKTDK
jgi:hypothetical protein